MFSLHINDKEASPVKRQFPLLIQPFGHLMEWNHANKQILTFRIKKVDRTK